MSAIWNAPLPAVVLYVLLVHVMPLCEAANATAIIGARAVAATPSQRETYFIAPNGSGDRFTESAPGNLTSLDLYKRSLKVKPGDVVFFRGGVYKLSMEGARRVYLMGGTASAPVIYESYPGETAIFDGSSLSTADTAAEEWREGRLQLRGEYAMLRRVEVRNMPQYGVRIFGNHNIVEGCKIHDNHLSGVEIGNLVDGYSTKDTGGSYNIVRDNTIYANSDVGLTHGNFGDGDNADGITIHSGVGNLISHNTVYANSDDGIDTWRSMKSIVEYNLVYDSGRGPRGNGNGIKLGGAGKDSPLGADAIARHNIVHSNKAIGLDINSGKNVLMEYNTVFNNQGFGYTLEDDTRLKSNISFQNKAGHFGWSKGKEQTNNSWQQEGPIAFVSTDPASLDFLKPVTGSAFEQIGAYGVEADRREVAR